MDFKDSIKRLAENFESLKDKILTEEATKTSLILPFINALGYDIFNPREVLPEMCCDIGTKKARKSTTPFFKMMNPLSSSSANIGNRTFHSTKINYYATSAYQKLNSAY